VEQWSCQQPESAGRLAEEHRRCGESPWGERVRGHGEWRPSGTPTTRGPLAWQARDDDKRRRGQRIWPRLSRGPGPRALREARARGSGRRGRGRRSDSRASTGPESAWPRVAQAGSTGPNVARTESTGPREAQAGSTGPREVEAQAMWPHMVWEELRAGASMPMESQAKTGKPRVARATLRGEVPGGDGYSDRTQAGSRGQWVGRRQQGETHLRRRRRDERL
jgi:hypothetical protein